MRKFTAIITIVLFGVVLFANEASAQNYPQNGLVFKKDFREGMEIVTIKRSQDNIPKDRTWVFFNNNKNVEQKIRFTTGKEGREGTALYSRLQDKIGVRTTAKMPKKGTVLITFRVGKMKERNLDDVEHIWVADIFMPTLVGKTPKSKTTILKMRPSGLEFILDKELNLIQEVKCDTSSSAKQYNTYCADLGLKHDEWATVAITFDSDKDQVTYYANGRTAQFDRVYVPYIDNNDPATIFLGETQFGDVSISSVAIYNRFLNNNELLAATSRGETGFTAVESPLVKPYIRMNWTFAYIQIALALLFILFNLFTKRWTFKPLYCLAGAIIAIFAVYIRTMLPVLPVSNFVVSTFAGDIPLNFPTTFMDQLSYVSKYNLPGVLISLFLCISVSFVNDGDDKFSVVNIFRFLLPFASLFALYFFSHYGVLVLTVALVVIMILAYLPFFRENRTFDVINKSSGKKVGQVTRNVGAGLIPAFAVYILVALLIAFLVSGIIIFLFNFWFIFIIIKNYILDDLNDD